MIDSVYYYFFFVLILEVILFVFLNMPSPHGVKAKVVNFITTNSFFQKLLKAHLALCFLAALFYLDLYQTEMFYTDEKQKLRAHSHGQMGSELRIGYLSYTVLKIQRNKYITFMLIYVSLALNLYILLLKHVYEIRDQFERGPLANLADHRKSERVEAIEDQLAASKSKKSN